MHLEGRERQAESEGRVREGERPRGGGSGPLGVLYVLPQLFQIASLSIPGGEPTPSRSRFVQHIPGLSPYPSWDEGLAGNATCLLLLGFDLEEHGDVLGGGVGGVAVGQQQVREGLPRPRLAQRGVGQRGPLHEGQPLVVRCLERAELEARLVRQAHLRLHCIASSWSVTSGQ
eukprot:1175465-Prorocentrum_minimum.AAC.1